ncbi:MAG: hypothetical protein K9M97_06335, partial [Akkermansiaceae bacterium]|nr:hypothetical protein [Akkermansiaceae bacterium]
MKQILPAPLSQRTLQLPRPHGIGRTAAFAALAAACCAATAQTVITDDFTNPTNWTTSMQSSPSTDLTVVGGRMNFVTPVVGEEFAGSMWNETLLPADRSWSVRIDAHLDALPMTDPDQFVSVLLGIGWTGNDERAGGGFNFFRHMYTNSFGIEDDFGVDGEDLPNAFYEAGLSSPDVGLRIDYDGAARAFTFWFDADGAAGGSSWVSKGTLEFGPWMDQVGMGPGQTFSVSITGSADLQAVAAGQAWLDNLVTVIGGLPAVTTGSATGVTTTTATLNGTVNPNGTATSAQFEYGLTNAYGSTAAVTLSPDNGSTVQDVSATISGLQAG